MNTTQSIFVEHFENKDNETNNSCNGLFFRARVSFYIGKNDNIVYKEEMRFLSSLSCKGCPNCSYIKEEFRECMPFIDGLPLYRGKLVDGGLYKLSVTNYYKSYFGEVDYDLEFVLLES